jgi:hypothetical protein
MLKLSRERKTFLRLVNQNKQYRQCTYNVTLRRVHETIFAVEKQLVLHFGQCVHACTCLRACMWVPGRVVVSIRIRAYSLANPAHNAYAPYCDVIRGPSVCTTFFDIIS